VLLSEFILASVAFLQITMSPPRSDEPKAPRDMPSVTRNSKDVFLALYAYRALYKDIGDNNRPEGDIRQRFTRYRAIRAVYAEHRVGETGNAYDNFMNQIESGALKRDDECVKKKFEEIMDSLDRDLERVSTYFSLRLNQSLAERRQAEYTKKIAAQHKLPLLIRT
jgi:hypothetical protein